MICTGLNFSQKKKRNEKKQIRGAIDSRDRQFSLHEIKTVENICTEFIENHIKQNIYTLIKYPCNIQMPLKIYLEQKLKLRMILWN